MDILDDMGVSKLSAKVFSKVNYSFKVWTQMGQFMYENESARSSQPFFHNLSLMTDCHPGMWP